MNTAEISQAASKIAGCLWSDREQTGTIAQQLRTVAAEPLHGTDGDLSSSDRSALLALAAVGETEDEQHNQMTSEKFAIVQDPSNPLNWGIIWETSGTQGGFNSEEAARKDALKQHGCEATANGWEW